MYNKIYRTFSIDIETMDLDERDIEFEAKFLKAHPNTKDPEKIEKQLEEKAKKLETKGALTDTCKIASIGIHVPGELPIVLHTFKFEEDLTATYSIDNMACSSEKDMLLTFYQIMSISCDEETEIIVAGRDFDLPKIRLACVRNRVQIPPAIFPGAGNRVYDVLFHGAKYFLAGSRFSVSLDELSQRLGVDTGDKAISGAEVPKMIREEEFEQVIIYNGLDAYKNTECYNMMTGRY